MNSDSTFGTQPNQLQRLFEIGLEKADLDEDTPPIKRWDLLKEKPGSRIGPYLITKVLGEGGMGIVYLAEQHHPFHRQVALKIIKLGMDSKRVIARFEMERQALALLDHPNIAHVFDAGTTESGRPYFVMEYVEGLPITEHCDHHKLTIDDRLKLFIQLCHAVHYAHQKGIIHRDIKPSNILVSVQNEQPVPKIIDFGVAKAISQPLTERTLYTEKGQFIGTPEYMSPEQADMASEDIDTLSDIYSLGVLLYVLLTGVLPFDPKKLRESGIEHIRQVICETDPKTPSTRLSSLSEEAKNVAQSRQTEIATLAKKLHRELEWIPLKAMRKARSERYRSASELSDDIRNYLKGAPLIAGPESTVYRIKKYVRRHRHFATASGVVIVSLVLGLIISVAMYLRSEQSREQEAAARAEADAVSDFLSGSVIELIDPYKVASEEITRRSLLDAISENLEQDFAGPPFAEAQIRYTLGYAYWSIGVYELAESYIKPAIEVCQNHLGPEHPITLEWTLTLGWTYLFQGRLREAEQLFTKTLDGMRRVMGESHKETVHSMWSLGMLYWWQGRYEEAEPLSEKAFEISMRQWGEEDWNTVQAMSILVWIYIGQSRYEKAEQLASKALAINLRLRGEKEFWTLNLKLQIAMINWYLGRYEQAEQWECCTTARADMRMPNHCLTRY
jgi:serine/threonine protein kinase